MRLKRLTISAYRSCINTVFSPHPNLSVLIGPNGSGKTNILHAIALTKQAIHEEYRSQSTDPLSRIKVQFEDEGKSATFTSSFRAHADEQNKDIITAAKNSWYLKDFTGSAKRVTPDTRYPRDLWYGFDYVVGGEKHTSGSGALERQVIERLNRFLMAIKYYSASQFTNPSASPVSFETVVDEKGAIKPARPARGPHASFLLDLYFSSKKPDDEKYQRFVDIIGNEGVRLVRSIKFKEIKTSSIEHTVQVGGKVGKRRRTRILVIPQFQIGTSTLSPNQLSEGTFRTLALLFYLTTKTSSVLLLEEPEVCVHHGLLGSILELIKNYSTRQQIIISSHSDFVLDQMAPENVFRVEGHRSHGTSVQNISSAMSHKELMALHNYLATEGSLGEVWRHGGLE